MVEPESAPTSPTGTSIAETKAILRGKIPDYWFIEIRRLALKLARATVLPVPTLADELAAAGLVALWQAAAAFDPSRGSPFEHLARRSIRNAMLTELRGLNDPTSQAQAVPLHAGSVPPAVLVSEEPGPAEAYERAEIRTTIREWLSTCEPRVQQAFALLYEQGLTQREAAAEMGLSQPRVSHYRRRLLAAAQRALVTLAA